MKPCELLQTMMDDGAWDGTPPVDIGDGFAVSPGENGIAVCGDHFGGMVAVPWDVVRKLAEYLPNAQDVSSDALLAAAFDLVAAARRVRSKFGTDDNGNALDWTEWCDVDDACNAIDRSPTTEQFSMSNAETDGQ